MTSPFDLLAANYQRLWSETPSGRSQRAQVWSHLDPLLQPGDTILDLGCGTGDDAVHFMARGVRAIGMDASARMVECARARGIEALELAFEDLDRLQASYSGAISNFGALNCVPDLRPIAAELSRLICPSGALAICIMGKFAPLETLRFVHRLDWRRATRRWSGRARWQGIDVFYHSAREIRTAFASDFVFERRVSIGRGDHQLYVFRRKTG
jgi:SAM-dependent methyltransferase